MHFNIISPATGLSRYSTLSRHHLVLPQVKNETYRKFYLDRKWNGDHIILDNGAYEGKQNPEQLLEAIQFYRPDVVVLPDFLLEEWDKTYAAAIGFLDRVWGEWVGIQYMYVPQSTPGKVMELIEGMVRALEDERISWIGIPRALATDISPDPLARVNLCNYIKGHYPDIKVHALGMVKGNLKEMELLRQEGCDSIDSSAPVWRGWNNYFLDDTSGKTIVGPVDFDCPLPPEGCGSHEIILQNLEACHVSVEARGDDSTQREELFGR